MSDAELKQDVMDELDFEPSIDAAHIGVAVDAGVVTLTGHVKTYAERLAAERAVARVKGVLGLVPSIEVRPAGTHMTADDEIAKRAASILHWNASVPRDSIRVRVQNGYVTLEGSVEWDYQRKAAATALQGVMGVTGVSNLVTIRQKASPLDIRQRIENALKRDAELDAAAIQVKVTNGTVTLEGKIDSYADRQIAERAAWAAPGVVRVEDRLRVG